MAGKHCKRCSRCYSKVYRQVRSLALLPFSMMNYASKAWCPDGHRTSLSVSIGHRARLLWPSRADGRPSSVHSFIVLFTLTPWGYTNKLSRSEMLFRYKELELGL